MSIYKFILTLSVQVFVMTALMAQSSSPLYSRVKIDLRHTDISEIAELGLEADHGHFAKGKHLINDYSITEINILRAHDIHFEILIDDVQAHYVEQNKEGHNHNINLRDADNCVSQLYNITTPVNYQYGSMGGYLTYDELLATLDQMVNLYPDLISVKSPIGDITTHEGRPIYWMRLSDNPNVEEDEPEILYTALHHAREPNSLSQMIFYIWYLLENYESNPEIQYLVNQTEMYFIPCVNPDGYVYNELTNPEGGGLWRKNRWAQDGTVYGVDLNRNYGYEWGFDDVGSSTDVNDDTFRGTDGFSEPETQAVRDFCNDHQFKIAFNYHSFGNLLIYPWGFSDEVTPDSSTFRAFGDAMSRENNFLAGTGTETVGYTVNGDSDDWMYGEMDSKPAIFSMTPEVGPSSFGFWPPQDQIDNLNKSTLNQNLTAAHLLHNYGEATERSASDFLTSSSGTLNFVLKKYGLAGGDLILRISAIGDDVMLVNNVSTWTLTHLEETDVNVDYMLSDDVNSGQEFQFLVEVDNGFHIESDTLTKTYLNSELPVILSDDGSNLDNWNSTGEWGVTTATFVSDPSSFTDTPEGFYSANSRSSMTLNQPIDLQDAQSAILNFSAKWEIEAGYDYVQILASTDNQNFIPLCGKYSVLGNGNQALGEPLYEGRQMDWIVEEIDLSEFVGNSVWLRYELVSDGGVELDGFYFDDMSVHVLNESITSTSAIKNQGINHFRVMPNPTRDVLITDINVVNQIEHLKIKMINTLGQSIEEKDIRNIQLGKQQFFFDTEELADGIYFLVLYSNGVKIGDQKVVKLND